MYRSLQTKMPQAVKLNVLVDHQEIRNMMSTWNTKNKQFPSIELSPQDARVERYLLSQFNSAFQHYSIPVGQASETYTQIEFRANGALALNLEVIKRVEAAQAKLTKKVSEHQTAIDSLNHLFSITVAVPRLKARGLVV